MHPGAWLLWTFAAATVAASTTNPFYLLPLVAVSWFVYTACRGEGPWANAFRFFLIGGVLVVLLRTALVLLGPLERGSIAAALLEGGRLAALLLVFGVFNAVSDPFRILKLSPRRFHEPALAAALALSLAPRTFMAARRVREAQRLRGIQVSLWRAWPALVIPVLETGMEEALTLAESMDARGHGRGARSRYRPERWRVASSVTAVTAAVAAGAFLFALFGGWGGLSVSTFPLRWPEASLPLVLAVFLLAAPALAPGGESR